jgi:hypothetical protein
MLVVMTAPLLGGIPKGHHPHPFGVQNDAFLQFAFFLAAITAMSFAAASKDARSWTPF